MKLEEIAVDQIDVTERRRADFGDLPGLVAGIDRVGLLVPILVDRNGSGRYRLIFGERRLRAVKMLGHEVVPALLREHLTEEEFRDIELEENDNRKALTEGERARTFESSKKLVEKAAKAAEVLKHNVSKPSTSPRGGRPAEPASTRAVAKALGTSQTDVRRAEQQVETATQFPFMQGREWKQSQVLAVRESIENLPEAERSKVATVLSCAKILHPTDAVDLVGKLAAKLPAERQNIYKLSESDDPRDRSLALTKAAERPPMPDPRVALMQTAIDALRRAADPYPTDPLTPRILAAITELLAIRALVKNVSFDARVKGASIQ